MQEANANIMANKNIKKSSINRPLLKLVVESAEQKSKTYFVLNLDENNNYVHFKGIEPKTSRGKTEEINEYSDVHNKALSGKYTVHSKRIPWHKVIEIVDVNYKIKK